jgi:lipoprotein-anchoring transpeptidase ErfK/SrfK
MSKQRLVLVAIATLLCGTPAALAQTAPLDLDRATRVSARSAAAKARAAQMAVMREREQDEVVGPPKFFERLFGGLPPFPPQFQFDPGFAPDGSFTGRRQYQASYGPEEDRRPIDPKYLPQTVMYNGPEKAGTIIIDTPNRFLYYVLGDGSARRYGIGVGRAGFTWSGVSQISSKREWPDWIPPDEMRARRPDLPHFMAGGPDNPLGARAMYLGTAVSSGCIRMRNEDVIDLYNRAKLGTRVVVI